MYRYLNIAGDAQHATFEPVANIQEILEGLPNLERTSDRIYKSTPVTPWLMVSIVNCDAKGNYPAGLSQTSATANLVEIICPDTHATNETYYDNLATKIAESLGWSIAIA